MENPLLIAKRKFDLRQWVLVTDWNPLTIYFYDEFYARFSVEEYNISEASMENAFVHLVNNSIGKNSEKFHDQIVAENGTCIDGFMWSYKDFKEYIQNASGGGGIDLVKTKIQPKMKEIVKNSLATACESIDHRKNSFELYGFDFMIDDSFNTWLIEINSSPACDYSTPVTEVYVKNALTEILNVVLDVKDWEKASMGTDKDSRGEKPSTGGWSCIHRGPFLDVPTASFGADLGVKGSTMKCPPKRAPLLCTSSSFILKGNSKVTVTTSVSSDQADLPQKNRSKSLETCSQVIHSAALASGQYLNARKVRQVVETERKIAAKSDAMTALMDDSDCDDVKEDEQGDNEAGGTDGKANRRRTSRSDFASCSSFPIKQQQGGKASIPIKLFSLEL